jgi:hypothetical protein
MNAAMMARATVQPSTSRADKGHGHVSAVVRSEIYWHLGSDTYVPPLIDLWKSLYFLRTRHEEVE